MSVPLLTIYQGNNLSEKYLSIVAPSTNKSWAICSCPSWQAKWRAVFPWLFCKFIILTFLFLSSLSAISSQPYLIGGKKSIKGHTKSALSMTSKAVRGKYIGPQSVPTNDVKRRIQRVWRDLFSSLVFIDKENDVLRKKLKKNAVDRGF